MTHTENVKALHDTQKSVLGKLGCLLELDLSLGKL